MEYINLVFEEVYKILFLLVPVLVSVAMIVWLDRRVWAFVQKRQGPNVVGPFGLLQSLADALKYIFKEIIIPASSNKIIFILAPIITMTLALIAWAVIPFGEDQVLANINVGILYIFAVSSLGVYGIIMGGWASNSKYPFLGSIRSAAQMVFQALARALGSASFSSTFLALLRAASYCLSFISGHPLKDSTSWP